MNNLMYFQIMSASLDGFSLGIMLELMLGQKKLNSKKFSFHVLVLSILNFFIALPYLMFQDQYALWIFLALQAVTAGFCSHFWFKRSAEDFLKAYFFDFMALPFGAFILSFFWPEMISGPNQLSVFELKMQLFSLFLITLILKTGCGLIWRYRQYHDFKIQGLFKGLLYSTGAVAALLLIERSSGNFFFDEGAFLDKDGLFRQVILITALSCVLILFWIAVSYIKRSRQVELYRDMAAMKADWIENIISSQQDLEKFHDQSMESIRKIRESLEQKNYESVSEGMKTFNDDLESTKAKTYCANPVANALLYAKDRECQKAGIELKTNMKIAGLQSIEDLDLCRALSNMLDNAIRACRALDDEAEKIIELNGTFSRSVLMLESINPYLPQHKNKIFGTGLGKQVMKDLTRKYNGSCQFNPGNDGFYHCELILTDSQISQ